ncbi:hypothetical protein Agabi119p4_467 [Agaricus bisporus var. burnettii]|uniref:Uncharacterized protein n=1 Tax=Agaricus bisporus var. burnettii TaxID=192524 RepID=A0A8H7KL29_AGABI|nr:hypothetical protein Agabi119p4_467 [Agaricus bisporus var. burnettii]
MAFLGLAPLHFPDQKPHFIGYGRSQIHDKTELARSSETIVMLITCSYHSMGTMKCIWPTFRRLRCAKWRRPFGRSGRAAQRRMWSTTRPL